MSINRRRFLAAFASVSAGVVYCQRALALKTQTLKDPTPPETEGPFYPIVAQADKDFDLTRIDGRSERAKGEVVVIEGKVLGTDGKPIAGATVDIWQANTFGRYRHPHDPSKAPLDENFQGWAIVQSGENGKFKFKTIVPGSYPVSKSWERPPHIHFKVSKRGYVEITTQMYFPNMALNEKDHLLQRKSSSEQKMMIASKKGSTEEGKDILAYDVVLQKA